MELTAGQTALIQTIAYFDVLDYPLTLLELRRFLNLKAEVASVFGELQTESVKKIIRQKNGYYCLNGRETIIDSRRQRYGVSVPKLKLAQYYAGWLSRFPWVRAVGLYSSLSLKNSRPDSDLDFFIITASSRVWSARFFINLFLKLFRLRPRPDRTADKICVSYLADENNLDLSLVNYNDDYYYYYGTGAFNFLAGDQQAVEKFFEANAWIKQFLPNWHPAAALPALDSKPRVKRLENSLGLIKEITYKKWQLKLLPDKYKQAEDGQRVILSDGLIKLHNNDKRLKYNQLFKDRFNSIINTID